MSLIYIPLNLWVLAIVRIVYSGRGRKSGSDLPPWFVKLIGELTGETTTNLRKQGKKKGVKSEKRAFAIDACKMYSGATYNAIAQYFNLTHVGSVCYPLTRIKKDIEKGGWKKEMNRIEKEYCIVKYT